MISSLRNFINATREVTCNKVLITLVNFCDKRVSVYQGCNGPVKNNGLQFPPPFDLVAATKMRREYFKDGKIQMSGSSNLYFHVSHKNSFTYPFKCVQRCMMTFQMDSAEP